MSLCREVFGASKRLLHNGMPGNARGARCDRDLQPTKEAAARLSSVVADAPAFFARPRCSSDAGPVGAPVRRPTGPEGRCRGERRSGVAIGRWNAAGMVASERLWCGPSASRHATRRPGSAAASEAAPQLVAARCAAPRRSGLVAVTGGSPSTLPVRCPVRHLAVAFRLREASRPGTRHRRGFLVLRCGSGHGLPSLGRGCRGVVVFEARSTP